MLLPQSSMGVNSAAANLKGSFLVLNLEANTVGLENACGFQAFPLRVSADNDNGNAATKDSDDQNADTAASVGNTADVVAQSSKIGSATLEQNSHKVIQTRAEEKKERKRRMRSNENVKRRGRKRARKATMKQRARERESQPKEMVRVPPLGGNESNKSGWSPPQYLLKLLGFFGWKVELRKGFGGFVYVSPQGMAYSSLPKVFEIFLHGNWKSGNLAQNFMLSDLAIEGEMGPENADLAKGNTGIKEQSGGKDIAAAESSISVLANTVGRCTRSILKKIVSKEGTQYKEEKLIATERQTNDNSVTGGEGLGILEHTNSVFPSHGESVRIRRSSRLSQKSASKGSPLDLEGHGSYGCLFIPEEDEKEEETSSTSDSEYELDDVSDVSDASMDDEYQNSCSRNTRELANLRKDLKNMKGVEMVGEMPGSRNLNSVDEEQIHPISSLTLEKVLENDPLDFRKDAPNAESTTARKDLLITAPRSSSKEDSNRCSPSRIEFSSSATKDSLTSGLASGLTSPVMSSMKVATIDHSTQRDTTVNKDHDLIECVAEDGDNNNKMAMLYEKDEFIEKKRTEAHDTIQDKPHGRKPKKRKRLHSGRLRNDETTQLPDPSSSKAQCAFEAPLVSEKLRLPHKRRKSADYSNPKGRKKKKSGGCGLMVKTKGKGELPEDDTSQPNATVLSWLIDAGILVENEKVLHKLKNGRKQQLRGFITRGGIRCNCCKKVMTLSEFEAHAGSEIYHPWSNISRASGESLAECLTSAWNKLWAQQREKMHNLADGDLDSSDDTCGICGDGGSLICCDNCSSTFHQDCVLLKTLPAGSWYCPHCICKFCKMAAQRSERNSLATNLYTCSQCHCKYHLECSEKDDLLRTSEQLTLFCGSSCRKVDAELSKMIGVLYQIPDGFSWTLLKRCDDEQRIMCEQRSVLTVECNIKLSVALSVLEECFLPLVDQRTGLDMLSQAVYNCGSHFKRLSYEGFYTAILQKDEEMVCVATLRIHGTRFAEMPFIGTRSKYRRKGMCKRLFEAIEDMLSSLHVPKLIIPSIPELLETWTNSFHFQPLEEHARDEIRSLSLVVFAETTLLQKTIVRNDKKDGDNQCCENHEINSIQGCADDWIEALISADESWFTSCYNSEILNQHDNSEVVVHLEEDQKAPAVGTLPVENKDGPLQNPDSPLAKTPPTESIAQPCELSGLKPSFLLPSYDRPFSATNMGTPKWLEATETPKDGNEWGRGCFSTTVRRQLFFRGTSDMSGSARSQQNASL